ncbi:InlB B-repeat-containing protein [Tichowtungia aerotolerans]|uniref:Bacterial repeat domain-containing protein n=1 Tax=Tichowtungia aerotolerans TaxID=2697043 RepID=A0A6P1LZY9_9BACT|nr:hypothetical protein [Tichowtungia aerotolerans]QHI68109.1 hypothetical protein GT409_01120 [Tichowtungia aerotolerans]
MMKYLKIILFTVLGISISALAVRSTNSVSATVDSRDYVLTISTPHGELFPSATAGVTTNSWHQSVYSTFYENPVFEQDGTILLNCAGFSGIGIAPASGSGDSTTVKLTNVVSSLTWEWDTSYWVTWGVSGLGAVQPIDMAYSGNGAWFPDGGTNHLRAVPDYGWLFTGWSGGTTTGPSATNLYFTATAPTNLLASFSDDPDGDGLKNTNEWAVGANPWMANTDGDDYDDLFEFNNGLSPTRDSAPFISYIRDNPDTYGLYSSNAVLDVAVGQVALGIEGTTARLRLQVEKSEDLVTWTNAGDVVEWTLPVGGEKQFLRVRSAPGE